MTGADKNSNLTCFYLCALAITLTFTLFIPPAHCKKQNKIPIRKFGIHQKNKDLHISFGFKDVITSQIQKKLKSGLATIINVHIQLEQDKKPVSYWRGSTTVVFDLWEEIFIVTMSEKEKNIKLKIKTLEKVVEKITSFNNKKIASVKKCKSGKYRFHVLVEVNPVSREMVKNIQKWLARPPTGGSQTARQSNFFGSFVGVFIDRDIGKADNTLIFYSQYFEIIKQ